MQVNNIITLVLNYLNKSSLIRILSTNTPAENAECGELLNMLNLILNKIATEYVYCLNCEEIDIGNSGEYLLSNLQKPFYAVRSLKNSYGENCFCYERGGVLYAKEGKYKLLYLFLPTTVSFGNSILCFPSSLTEDAVALGVVAEYFLKYGFYEEYEVFQYKFVNKMQKSSQKYAEVKVKNRKWV